ncbi:hypothetical protein EJ04DRAFT_90371 [Polyplosphaeria fusca]|uniref:Uncharacterized protein n=1 Tax=Polyplosphaeria fusca TaxID=682080 RepID=A0A9P4QJZ9_9PLEO|nr:hypothetical protein EJ04DRAFT_90371 [Polyplosphaeria fusca]
MAIVMRSHHDYSIAQLFTKLCQRTCDGCPRLAQFLDVFCLGCRCLLTTTGDCCPPESHLPRGRRVQIRYRGPKKGLGPDIPEFITRFTMFIVLRRTLRRGTDNQFTFSEVRTICTRRFWKNFGVHFDWPKQTNAMAIVLRMV